MKKLLLASCVAAIALAGTQAFALEIVKGKVVEHKEWSTGHIKSVIKNTSIPDAKLKKPFDKDSEWAALYLDIQHGTVGQPVTWAPHAFIHHSNMTEANEKISYFVGACVWMTLNDIECTYYSDTVELQPGGTIYGGGVPEVTTTFDQAGTYNITSFVSLMGDAQLNSSAESRIIVADGKK